MVIYYIYKIHFLCGFPSGRYYIGKHKHTGDLSNDKYAGSGSFCKAYFKKLSVNAPQQAIQRVCAGKRKTSHGYKWEYDYEES